MDLVDDLQRIIRSDPWFLSVLRAARDSGLPAWAVGAGAIRNLVWDDLHGYERRTPLADIDLVYFDSRNLRSEHERLSEERLARLLPGVPWQVKNQAAVHLWYQRVFGQAVPPLTSIEEAVATWPETATAVAVRLLPDDTLYVIAPFGLSGLFHMILRRNPARVSRDEFRRRCRDKAIQIKWPRVQLIGD